MSKIVQHISKWLCELHPEEDIKAEYYVSCNGFPSWNVCLKESFILWVEMHSGDFLWYAGDTQVGRGYVEGKSLSDALRQWALAMDPISIDTIIFLRQVRDVDCGDLDNYVSRAWADFKQELAWGVRSEYAGFLLDQLER